MESSDKYTSKDEPARGTDGLRRLAPVIPPAALGIGLSDPNVVLTPEQLAARNADLESLATARQQPLPDSVIVD